MPRVATLVALWMCCASAAATVLMDTTLEERLRHADLVVVGTVTSQKYVRMGRELMTETTVSVEETLKGAAQPSVVVSQIGGQEGTLRVDVPGDAQLHPGQRVVLLTYRHSDGKRYLVGMALGAFVLRGETLTQQVDVPLVTPDGTLRNAPATTETLSTLRRLARKTVRP